MLHKENNGAAPDTHHDPGSFEGVLKQLGRSAVHPPINPCQAPNPAEVSYPQEQLWFLSQFEPANIAYNVPLAWKLEGALDPDALEKCLKEIVRRHEALRTVFL